MFDSISSLRLLLSSTRHTTILKKHVGSSSKLRADESKKSDSPKEPEKQEKNDHKKELNQKLNNLLLHIITDKPESDKKIKLTTPVKTPRIKQPVEKEARKSKTPEDLQILSSVKAVANEIGGDVIETQSELLNKLLGSSAEPRTGSIHSVIAGMKTERSSGKDTLSDLAKKAPSMRNQTEWIRDGMRKASVQLFDSAGLAIFPDDYKPDPPKVTLPVWKKMEQKRLEYLSCLIPRNIYDEWADWTKKGKLWHFPIDNEQGMHEESKVHFSQHVFLEEHLEPWCPKKGPIRHFMDLVLVGLSKNPYLRVQDKIDHIFWYRDYFESKRKLLTEVDAYGTEATETSATNEADAVKQDASNIQQ